jgi:murein DD-endopeptidase MepM/ murein hydrolase activator NlpD
MKISLFYKSYAIKACSLVVLTSFITGAPTVANAGFFNDIFSNVVGKKTQASDGEDKTSGNFSNSQTVQVLATASVDPDTKNAAVDTYNVNIVEGGAISPESLQTNDSEINSYISSSDKIMTYTVKSGDSIGEVASKFGISKNTIIYANTDIKNNTLKVGQILTILPVDGVPYTVKKGDTINSIAKSHKALASEISEYNDISDKNLQAGDKIIVPGGMIATKTTTTTPAVAVKVVQKEQPVVAATVAVKETEKPDVSTEKEPVKPIVSSGNGITGGYIWPFPSGTGRVSQRLHDDNAYDFSAPKGTPIYAISDGKILISDASGYNGGYGLYVVVDFDDGAQAIFGHMSKVASEVGDIVKQGDIIGYVGSTGRSTGNHVHIGYRGGKSNPYRNLSLGSSL